MTIIEVMQAMPIKTVTVYVLQVDTTKLQAMQVTVLLVVSSGNEKKNQSTLKSSAIIEHVSAVKVLKLKKYKLMQCKKKLKK